MNTNRFKQLLESTLGNVKTLLSESLDSSCLREAGFTKEYIGGPMVRRMAYVKKQGGITYRIDGFTPEELEITKNGTSQYCSWTCDSTSPIGIKYSGCKVKVQPLYEEEGKPDRDWWSLDLAPKLKDAGFVSRTDPPQSNRPCYYKCCTYMYKGNHNTGTNVFLDCGEGSIGEWLITVYNKGNQNIKTFPAGTEGAKKAVEYALSLK